MKIKGFYERLKELCDIQGLKRYDLAIKSNLPESTVYNMIRRKSMPGLETIDMLCNGLGVSLSEFFREGSSRDYTLTSDDEKMIELNHMLTPDQRQRILAYMQGMAGVELELEIDSKTCDTKTGDT